MNYIKIRRFADQCVTQYSKFDPIDNEYTLNVYDLPDFVQSEFASLLLSTDAEISNESTGPDNPAYEKYMLPSLTKFLNNITDKDSEIDFIDSWKRGLIEYNLDRMQEFIDDSLSELNTEKILSINHNQTYRRLPSWY